MMNGRDWELEGDRKRFLQIYVWAKSRCLQAFGLEEQ
jgi:hypothetical protein